MEPSEVFESRDDVSSITSFELVRTRSRTKYDSAETATIAFSELTLTEELTVPLPSNSRLTIPPNLRLWRDIVQPWLVYGKAVLVDSWWPEMAALAFSFSCLGEIAIILRYYDGYPVSKLPLGLTLNTMLSLLAAGSKSSLIFAVAGTMSQCKWCWLRPGRPDRRRLDHLEVIDEASRGPLGSIRLLLGHTMALSCYLGATIIVLGLAYEPFVQQVVSYPVQQTNMTSPESTTIQALGIEPSTFSESMAGYALAGIVAGVYGSSFPERTPSCSGGNCTWDPFWSVGWCAKCEAHRLTSSSCTIAPEALAKENRSESCDFSFQSGKPLPATFQGTEDAFQLNYSLIWSLGAYDETNKTDIIRFFDSPHRFLGETNPLLALGYALPITAEPEFVTEVPQSMQGEICLVSPCSRQYNVSVVSGRAESSIINEDYGTIFTGYGQLCWRPNSTDVNEVRLEMLDNTGIYADRKHRVWCGIDPNWIDNILSMFQGSYGTIWLGNQWRLPPPVGRSGNYILDKILPAAHYDPDEFMPNIAEALTYLNTHSETTNPSYLNLLPGTLLTDKTFVIVRWAWLSLPIALDILGLIFLIVVAIHSKRRQVPLWKSSAFALLYHGLEDKLLDEDRLYKKASDMERAASTTYVRLAPSESGKRLLLRS